jgi:hypothetical protein
MPASLQRSSYALGARRLQRLDAKPVGVALRAAGGAPSSCAIESFGTSSGMVQLRVLSRLKSLPPLLAQLVTRESGCKALTNTRCARCDAAHNVGRFAKFDWRGEKFFVAAAPLTDFVTEVLLWGSTQVASTCILAPDLSEMNGPCGLVISAEAPTTSWLRRGGRRRRQGRLWRHPAGTHRSDSGGVTTISCGKTE